MLHAFIALGLESKQILDNVLTWTIKTIPMIPHEKIFSGCRDPTEVEQEGEQKVKYVWLIILSNWQFAVDFMNKAKSFSDSFG